MKSFRNFMTEERMTTRDQVVAAVATHKKAGEILNPQYQDLLSQSRRIFGSDTRPGRDAILAIMHKSDDRDPVLNDLYYSWPSDSFVSLGKIEKLAAKLKPEYKEIADHTKTLVKAWKPISDDLKALKSKVVKVSQKRAEAKAAAEVTMKKKFADSSSLIKIFESHLQEYKDMAEKQARAFIKERLDFLKKHGMDLDKAVPKTRDYNQYKSVEAKRSFYRSITKAKHSVVRADDPDIRVPHTEMIERYVRVNVQAAEDSYRGFMHKMIQKIGKPVVDAKMTGNIWTNATLTVTTDDGEKQVWSTKMILNFSKYQTMFNQFPTRRKS